MIYNELCHLVCKLWMDTAAVI